MKTFELPRTTRQTESLWRVSGLNASDGVGLIRQISEGLEGEVANRVAKWANISQIDLRQLAGIPSTTFNRGLKHRFNASQSERLVRVIRVIDRTVTLFEGDKTAAQKWLNEPNRGLNWQTPAELISSETGAYEVLQLITRIEHGVYS
ncbi:antitoxin Xre/MbcA/ParS toxin-binding domain-containing protein [Brenneria populi subsp. brevivirga]|uniref:type II RES/Xre toxin-antitoxin system antitoxin n=1 Tax=Brenneria populi TaxID=1505588 RepID=UPI002E17F656|nr:antitoxin Xre/MbcA/ParS toxin-binding domain-containing protein [Brenneria populi subsp. brevivirga]